MLKAIFIFVAALLQTTALWSQPAGTQPTTEPSVDTQYADLLRKAEGYNQQNPDMDGWLMNCEHCFLVPASGDVGDMLQDRVIAFVRRPGALNYVFGRLLDGHPADEAILADSQFLIFAGEYFEHNGEVIPGGIRASELLRAAETGRFAAAEKHYPKAPIREKIVIAAKRALSGMK